MALIVSMSASLSATMFFIGAAVLVKEVFLHPATYMISLHPAVLAFSLYSKQLSHIVQTSMSMVIA
jgi:hypothetical protein